MTSPKAGWIGIVIGLLGAITAGFSWLETRSTARGAKIELASSEVLQLEMLQRLVRLETILERTDRREGGVEEELGAEITVVTPPATIPILPSLGVPALGSRPNLVEPIRSPHLSAEGVELLPPDVLFDEIGTSAEREQGGSAPKTLRAKPPKADPRVQQKMEQYDW